MEATVRLVSQAQLELRDLSEEAAEESKALDDGVMPRDVKDERRGKEAVRRLHRPVRGGVLVDLCVARVIHHRTTATATATATVTQRF